MSDRVRRGRLYEAEGLCVGELQVSPRDFGRVAGALRLARPDLQVVWEPAEGEGVMVHPSWWPAPHRTCEVCEGEGYAPLPCHVCGDECESVEHYCPGCDGHGVQRVEERA